MSSFEKPWGYELWWARTDRYVGKLLHVKAGSQLSLQYHVKKDETIHLWSGEMVLVLGGEGGALVDHAMRAGRDRIGSLSPHRTPSTDPMAQFALLDPTRFAKIH